MVCKHRLESCITQNDITVCFCPKCNLWVWGGQVFTSARIALRAAQEASPVKSRTSFASVLKTIVKKVKRIKVTTSSELERWIEEHGNERDALNVALTRLSAARFKLNALQNATLYMDCPKCDGVYLLCFVCLNCGYDSDAGK